MSVTVRMANQSVVGRIMAEDYGLGGVLELLERDAKIDTERAGWSFVPGSFTAWVPIVVPITEDEVAIHQAGARVVMYEWQSRRP